MLRNIMLVLALALFSGSVFADGSCPEDLGAKSMMPEINKGIEKNANPPQELAMCALGVTMGGLNPKKVLSTKCGCKKRVSELCSFRVSKKRVSGPAGCAVFAPWRM